MINLEQAAKEYAERMADQCVNITIEHLKEYACQDFKAGVAFAEEWISVKDELPDYDQPILIKDIHGNYDLMYFRRAGDEGVSDFDEDVFINNCIWSKLSEKLITHWRPINRK